MQGDRDCGICYLLPEPNDHTDADQHSGSFAGCVCVLTSQASDEACCYVVMQRTFPTRRSRMEHGQEYQ